MKKDWSNYGLIALLPLLFVIIVYSTEAFARNSFFGCGNENCEESIPENIWNVLQIDTHYDAARNSNDHPEVRIITALRYSGRMAWYFIAEVFFFASLGSLAIGAAITFLSLPRFKIFGTIGLLLLAFLTGLFFFSRPDIHMAIFRALFQHAISVDVERIDDFANFLDSLGNAALVSLLVAICSNLLPVQGESMEAVSTRMKYLRIILYTGTFLLVTAILLKKAVYQWALAYTPQNDGLAIARDFVASLLSLDGGFYTLVLAAGYFPAALVLHRRAQLLVGLSTDDADQEAKLKQYGLNLSIRESLPRILIIMAPFLTGPVGELLSGKLF